MGKTIKYPAGERVWVSYFDKNKELMFILTSKESRDFYFLYENKDGSFVKLGRGKSPPDLLAKFQVEERLRKG